MDQQRVLADESETRLLSVAAFEDRTGVDVPLGRGRPAERALLQFSGELFERRAHDIVIILPPRISRDPAAQRVTKHVLRRAGRRVIQPDDDQCGRAGHDHVQITATRDTVRTRHVAHRPVHSSVDPCQIAVQCR
ncbi:MAG: hypothetical protein HND48_15090 [Chloroflexi bacterium]|nr:hypothetical protein [Chloroflexota bacterium]